MSDITLRSLVLATLKMAAVNKIRVSMGGYEVTPLNLYMVRDAVLYGRILCRHITTAGGTYETGKDWFEFTFDKGNLTRHGLIVHESIHAACDMKSKQMRTDVSEALAYTGQCIFVRQQNTKPGQRLSSSDSAMDKIFKLAWDAAGIILAGKSPSAQESKGLIDAVRQHPWYKSNALMKYNGVRSETVYGGTMVEEYR